MGNELNKAAWTGGPVEYSPPKAVTREPEIPAQLAIQNKSLSELQEYLLRLEERLQPVLRPAGPADGSEDPGVLAVPLADAIRFGNARIQAATAFVNGLLTRLEL